MKQELEMSNDSMTCQQGVLVFQVAPNVLWIGSTFFVPALLALLPSTKF
jgi:hypothetical protein